MDNKFFVQDRFTRNPLLHGDFGTPDGKLGVNLPIDKATRGTLHVYQGESGFAGSVGAGANAAIIEGAGNAGVTILTPATAVGTVGFGDDAASLRGWIQYDHATDVTRIGAAGGTRLQVSGTGIGFNGASVFAKPTLNGLQPMQQPPWRWSTRFDPT